ncbi:tRNA 2-thiouridine(34) synthase MnmA [bacterium]|nr:tRNA 2-thiouridine(34) synthase MnmA [bacterium]NBX98554.1 tRNA 2-thiouridine(34) synthase MnmA [bacterium]NDC93813.1 tRNA 2-thiouridine(34) synthase MnmA [bacterium]NDD83603.1 tRNA 2-thiouridine(34) synthase MnmA [bacterium]NDG28759.1 tRNA 2-thiouridine(34) synthase MnmA [bacterium]
MAAKKTVYVGLSGGVDSSVSAALLKEQGYNVVGVYMKNWSKDLPGYPCPWKDDYQDAKRVAVQLGIEFKMFDFEKEYFTSVVQYMLDGFEAGITPNPDIMCNQEVKFKLYLKAALQQGADYVATGHYANSRDGHLFAATDTNKDQTYFLYRMTNDALTKTLFPLAGYTKPQVRELAKKFKLVTATKKESMGICFVGKVGIKEFLQQFLPPQKPGAIVDQNGVTVGQHDGAIYYTIGQRHGLNVGGGLPYYVTSKDMAKNEVYVTSDIQDEKLWSSTITITSPHWLRQPVPTKELVVRTRHRGPLTEVTGIEKVKNNCYTLHLSEPLRALTPGQSAVLYHKNECIGGGIIC